MVRDIAKVAEALGKVKGVVKVIISDADVRKEMFELEDDVKESSFGLPLINKALKAAKSNDECLVVFCDISFESPRGRVVAMEGKDGSLIGFDVPRGDREKCGSDPNLVWIGDGFAIKADYVDQMTHVTILPQRTECIGFDVGVCNVSITYLAVSADVYLRNKFGISIRNVSVASTFTSFDWLN